MKQAILFTLSFLAVSLALTWFWVSGGNAIYAEFMNPVARELNRFLGLRGGGTMGRARFINLVPFVSLMLLTPGFTLRKRLRALALGTLILVLSHLALNAFAVASRARGFLPPTAALASDAMPFLLWFYFARHFVQDTMRRVRGEASTETTDQVESDSETTATD